MRALGDYSYTFSGVPQAVGEPWTLMRTGSGFVLQGVRLLKGTPTLVVEAEYERTSCTAMRVEWLGMGEPRTVHYRLVDGELDWRDGGRSPQRVSLPPGCLMFPLLRAGTGPLLRELAMARRAVVMPDLRAPRSAQFLTPLLSERRAERPAGAGGSHYRYFGGEYGEDGSDWWVDSHGIVSRYTWATPQGDWDVRLENLAADPGFEFR